MNRPQTPPQPIPASGRKPCRVLLVDQALRLGENARPMFDAGEVVKAGEPATFSTMLQSVLKHKPDVVVVELASGEGAFAAIESVMAERPTPILVLHRGTVSKADTFRALAFGALDVAERPEQPTKDYWLDLSRKLTL